MKLLVLGLDGATFDLLEPWMQAGKLERLRGLVARGSAARMHSTTPPVTAPAWVTCFSGVNPGRHGIFNFFQPVGPFGRLKVNSSQDVKVPRLWHLLSQAGLKTCVVDVPMTFPPEPIRGCMVSDRMVSGTQGAQTWPPELQATLAREVDVGFDWAIGDGLAVSAQYLEHLAHSLAHKTTLDLYLLRTQQPEVFITVAQHTDVLAHYFWHVWDTSHPFHDAEQAQALRPGLDAVLAALDAYVGAMLDAAGANTHVAVVSDHGFGPVHQRVYPNTLLEQWGMLTLAPLDRIKWALSEHGLSRETLVAGVRRLDRWGLRSRLRLSTARALMDRLEVLSAHPDPVRSQAVFVHGLSPGIHVTQAGVRTPGCVDSLIERLRAVRDAQGRTVFERVARREDIYHGRELGLAPEVIFQLAPGYVASPEMRGGAPIRPGLPGQVSGFHRPEGVFVLAGPGIPSGVWLDPVSIQDVTPTLLDVLGLSSPLRLDGRVLREALETSALPEAPRQGPADFIADASSTPDAGAGSLGPGPRAAEPNPAGPFSDEEEALIRARLAALGYL